MFSTFPIHSIFIDRSKRQRRELEDIPLLASSIQRTGMLINPIVIRQDGELVAGERRLEACRSLGWTSIPVQFLEEMSEEEAYLLELEENVARSDLPWKDLCLSHLAYHELRQRREPGWTKHDTAVALNLSDPYISATLSIAKALREGDPQVAEAGLLSTARSIVERKAQRKQSAELGSVASFSLAPAPPLEEGETPLEVAPRETKTPLLLADFTEWAPLYEGPKFNFLHCDFPYGIDAQDQQQGANTEVFGHYEDSEEVYWSLLRTLENSMERLITPNAHMMFWFSPKLWDETKTWLVAMGWKVDPFPLIWLKSDNAGLLPDHRRGPRRIYETAFFCTRGERFIAAPVSNAIASPSTKLIHMSEKPVPVLSHFFRLFVDETTVMLDPTCGSATAVKVAQRLGAKSVLGLEKNPEFLNLAKEHFND
jgi:ParB/RepB/Spo0J family partition protein